MKTAEEGIRQAITRRADEKGIIRFDGLLGHHLATEAADGMRR